MENSTVLTQSQHELPTEIWERIFHHSLPAKLFVAPHIKKSPLVLTQVSSEWRRLAISTPTLWSSIKLTTQTSVELARVWFGWSGTTPLTIWLVVGEKQLWRILRMFELVVSHIERWRTIRLPAEAFYINYEKIPMVVIPEVPLRLTQLKDFQVELRREYWSTYSLMTGSLASYRWSLFGVEMPLAQMENLQTNAILSEVDIAAILRSSPLLRKVSVVLGINHQRAVPANHVTSSSLHSLVVTVESGVQYSNLFANITLPILDTLEISVNSTPDPGGFHALHSFLERSNSRLSRLKLVGVDFTPARLAILLEALSSSLTRLKILCPKSNFISFDDATFKLLTPSQPIEGQERAAWLCPRLNQLVLVDCLKTTDGVLSSMFRARWEQRGKTVSRLNRVFVSPQARNKKDTAVMGNLIDEGLRFRFFTERSVVSF